MNPAPIPARPSRPAGAAATLLAAAMLAGPAASAPDADAVMAEKLAGYIDCINEHSHWVRKSEQRYLSWIRSARQGPTGREQVVYGLYELFDPADCRRGIDAAASLPPDDAALEQAAGDYITALEAAVAIVAEAHTYYELEDYRDDAMRQGKALHPRLMAAFDAFSAANTRLYAAVDTLKAAATERRLQQLAADPALQAEFLVERLLFDARRMLELADGLGRKDFDRAAFADSVQRYEAAWKALDAFRKAHPKHPLEQVSSSWVADAAFALLKTAKATQRRERDGFRFDEGEQMLIDANAAQMVEGHPATLIEAYNRLIEHSNRARH